MNVESHVIEGAAPDPLRHPLRRPLRRPETPLWGAPGEGDQRGPFLGHNTMGAHLKGRLKGHLKGRLKEFGAALSLNLSALKTVTSLDSIFS